MLPPTPGPRRESFAAILSLAPQGARVNDRPKRPSNARRSRTPLLVVPTARKMMRAVLA